MCLSVELKQSKIGLGQIFKCWKIKQVLNYTAILWILAMCMNKNFMILLITVCCFSMLLNQLSIDKALNELKIAVKVD